MLAAVALLAAACESTSETITAPAQLRCATTVVAEPASFPPGGGAGTLSVTTSRECAWTAQSGAGWLVLAAPASGQGNGNVQFTVSANDAPDVRTALITLNDHPEQISQQGRPCEFDISSDHEAVPAEGGDRRIEVTASSTQCGWTATTGTPWITIVEGGEGRGNGAVTFRVAAAAGPQRSGALTIAGETVHVDQGTGCAFSVNPSRVDVGGQGGEPAIRVDAASAACTWTAAANAPWITIVGSPDRSGSGTLVLRVAATTGPQRSGTLTVAGQTIPVNQGTGCAVTLNPQSTTVSAEGGAAAIDVQSGAGCPWTAAANHPWISVAAGGQGTGNGRVELTLSPNPGPARSGGVAVGGHTFAIAQASGCSYSIAPADQDVPATGTTTAVAVSTGPGCPWTAESSAGWLSLSAASGTGAGTIGVTSAPNHSPARTGTIRVAGHTFTVRQASICTYTFAPPSHEFSADGGNGNVLVIVSGPCTWSAESTAGWIELTSGAAGTEDGLVQFVVPANPGPPRTGFILIAGQQYQVSQESK